MRLSKATRGMLLAAAAVAGMFVFFPQTYVWVASRLGKSAEVQEG